MNMQFHRPLAGALAAVALTLLSGAPLHAQAQQAAAPAANTSLTAGVVRKVDLAQGKVTIRHERIANLDMDAMTMVFRAGKPEQLKGLKAGDKIRFRAESNKGALVATHIEAAK
jgi:Cu(I)/Ag(I) efflux system periplasmic protein CusF